MLEERHGEAGRREKSGVCIQLHPAAGRMQTLGSNHKSISYNPEENKTGSSCWGVKGENNWNLIISLTKVTDRTSVEHKMKRRGGDGGGGGGVSLSTTWLLKRKRENRAGLEKWRKLRKRGCARQTLPTVEPKCYCKVTCKVAARRTLTPTYRLASSRSVHSLSLWPRV